MKRIIFLSSVLCFQLIFMQSSFAEYSVKIPLEFKKGGSLSDGSIIINPHDGTTNPPNPSNPTTPIDPTDPVDPDLPEEPVEPEEPNTICPDFDDNNYYYEMVNSNGDVIYTEIKYWGHFIQDSSWVTKNEFIEEFVVTDGITPTVYSMCYVPPTNPNPDQENWVKTTPSYGPRTYNDCGYWPELKDVVINTQINRQEFCDSYTDHIQQREQDTESLLIRDVGEPESVTVNEYVESGKTQATTCYYDYYSSWNISNKRVDLFFRTGTAYRSKTVTSFAKGLELWIDYQNQPLHDGFMIGRGGLMQELADHSEFAICAMTP